MHSSPIDNQLFGNQGQPHNYSFTLATSTNFTYQGNEVFTFTGDDDVFVFINRHLAIDLGGVHNAETASVKLADRAKDLKFPWVTAIRSTSSLPSGIQQGRIL